MSATPLFPTDESRPDPVTRPESDAPPRSGAPRFLRPEREQASIQLMSWENILPLDHEARSVWKFVEGLDLTPLYDRIAAREGVAGRPAFDPRMLFALWLYATLESVASARHLEEMCESHIGFLWICGGVEVNYHSLSDFRTAHDEFLCSLIADATASLVKSGVVTLRRVAQDGMKVRASAGSSSFRTEKTLEELKAEAAEHLQELKRELVANPDGSRTRQEAARKRAAEERAEKVDAALSNLPKEVRKRKAKDPEGIRASTTDPDARVMRMADGGFRPAFNVQFATDVDSGVVVGMQVTNSGTDAGQIPPMIEQITRELGRMPAEVVADGGYATIEHAEYAAEKGCTFYAPAPRPRQAGVDRYARRADDTEAVGAWRKRMGTEEAKTAYKDRCKVAELLHAHIRGRGLYQFFVRGVKKIAAAARWHVLAQNYARAPQVCACPA